MMQTLCVILILAAAMAYIGHGVCQLWLRDDDPCRGCDGCIMKKQVCDKKKDEKFGQSK